MPSFQNTLKEGSLLMQFVCSKFPHSLINQLNFVAHEFCLILITLSSSAMLQQDPTYPQNESQHKAISIYTLWMSLAQSLFGAIFSQFSCFDAFYDALSKQWFLHF